MLTVRFAVFFLGLLGGSFGFCRDRMLECEVKLKDAYGQVVHDERWSAPLVSDSVYYYADLQKTIFHNEARLRLSARYGLNYRFALLSISNEGAPEFSIQFDGNVDLNKPFRLSGSLMSLGVSLDLKFFSECRFVAHQDRLDF